MNVLPRNFNNNVPLRCRAGQTGAPQGSGVYNTSYTLKPGVNTVTIDATAGITVQRTHNACPNYCTPLDQTAEGISQSLSGTKTVYGVDITLNPIPTILVDQWGFAASDYPITYTIAPPAYQALSAYVFIYKNGGTTPVATIPAGKQGTGTATIGRGFWFDINSTYEAEVVLNSGTGVEMKSGKKQLKVINFDIIKPLDDEQIIIKNNASGDPIMPTLTAEVQLKGTGIDPATINTQKIYWKFKVEYKVNTVAAPERSRTGLDPTGAGNGTDGFLIPTAGSQSDWLERTGPTFIIDENGTNGTKWDTNFGGGILTITAKTTIEGVEVSDTYTGKIEGETTTATSRTQMINYLKQAAKNGNPSLETELGSADILFALACVETGVNHFWTSIYGDPKGAIYPRENTGGDGGFGLMQLTLWGPKENIQLPSYLQIWNWKKNVDASIEVVNEKIAIAKKQSSTLTQDQIKMNVYSLFRGGYYWKKVRNKETYKYDWVPRYDSESEDEDERQSYWDSGVSEADKAVENEGSNTCQ